MSPLQRVRFESVRKHMGKFTVSADAEVVRVDELVGIMGVAATENATPSEVYAALAHFGWVHDGSVCPHCGEQTHVTQRMVCETEFTWSVRDGAWAAVAVELGDCRQIEYRCGACAQPVTFTPADGMTAPAGAAGQ
jgi:hypothetical protein